MSKCSQLAHIIMSQSYELVASRAEDLADLLAEQGHLRVMRYNAYVQQQAYAGIILCLILKYNSIFMKLFFLFQI